MKKITLTFAALVAAFSLQAQTTYFSDNFDDEDISDWTLYDEDGDTHQWEIVALDAPLTPAIASYSYDNATNSPLNPNNWIVSPAIDLSSASGATLKYEVKVQDPAWPNETYSVYVATTSDVASFLTAGPLLTENAANNGPGGIFYPKQIDVSAFDGQTVYIAFRHYNSSDMFSIHIDNVIVDGTASTTSDTFSGFNYFVSNSELNLSANSAIEMVDIYNVLGQKVTTQNINHTSGTINLGSLQNGVYVGQVTIEGETKSFKFVKK